MEVDETQMRKEGESVAIWNARLTGLEERLMVKFSGDHTVGGYVEDEAGVDRGRDGRRYKVQGLRPKVLTNIDMVFCKFGDAHEKRGKPGV